MKNKVIGVLLLSGIIIFPISSNIVNTKERYSKDEYIGFGNYINNVFSGYENDEKVFQFPNGGFLKGQATLIKEDGTEVELNSESDAEAITVYSAKKSLEKQLNNGTLQTE